MHGAKVKNFRDVTDLNCLHCLGHEQTAVIILRCIQKLCFFFIKTDRYCWGYLYFHIVSLQCKIVGWYG